MDSIIVDTSARQPFDPHTLSNWKTHLGGDKNSPNVFKAMTIQAPMMSERLFWLRM